MAVSPGTDTLGPLLTDLLDCSVASLEAAERPVVGRVHLAPGAEVAWDGCCEGQLYVRVVSLYPSGPFPQQNLTVRGTRCHVNMLAAQVAVGVLRCAETIDDRGTPPAAETRTEETLDMTADAAALLDAIMCCYQDTHPNLALVVGQWSPLGPQGQCVGGEWMTFIQVPTCGCG